MAGSLLGHKGAISSLDFHPNEFLLASGSADGSAKFWDLETLKVVSTTEIDSRATPVVGTSFTPDGRALLVATKEQLRVVGWEPRQVYDTVPCKFDDIMDIGVTTSSSHLIACSTVPFKPASFIVQGLDLKVFLLFFLPTLLLLVLLFMTCVF